MSQYDTLDKEIVLHLKHGQPTHPLYARRINAEAERIAALTGRDAYRIIDGRLSALKAKGTIQYDRSLREWACVPQP